MKKLISIIITAWKEPTTVQQLVLDLESQIQNRGEQFEILLLCPDKQTADSGIEADSLGILQWIMDEGVGKPVALNLAFSEARGNILILTDGDVKVGQNAVEELLGGFAGSEVGAVTGHPVPINSRKTMFGYWAHLLTEAGAHVTRLRHQYKKEFLVCSGYLMAIRAGMVESIPENILVDDAYISHVIWNKGDKVVYVPDAKVYVKFPTNFADWLKQKKRSVGGYVQLDELLESRGETMRSFGKEVGGIIDAIKYPETFIEYWWTLLLVLAKLYLWLLIFWERKIIHKSFEKTWVRVESTK